MDDTNDKLKAMIQRKLENEDDSEPVHQHLILDESKLGGDRYSPEKAAYDRANDDSEQYIMDNLREKSLWNDPVGLNLIGPAGLSKDEGTQNTGEDPLRRRPFTRDDAFELADENALINRIKTRTVDPAYQPDDVRNHNYMTWADEDNYNKLKQIVSQKLKNNYNKF